MTTQPAETTPAALAQRAAAELAQGGYETAKVTALVAIAGALVAMLPDPVAIPPVSSIRHDEPGGYLAGVREGLRRAARAAQDVARVCCPGSDAAEILSRLADALERQSCGEIRLDKADR